MHKILILLLFLFKGNPIMYSLARSVCPSHCSSCVMSACLGCSSGYYWSTLEQLCPQCSTGCATCTSASSCNSCIAKYYLSVHSCLACPNECATCTSSSVCNTCITGYYISSSQCTQCPTGCSACSSGTNCSSCITNYYISSNLCYACPTQCGACTSSTVCNSCADGYYLSGNTCLPCTSPCQKCVTSSTQCTACINNYGLIGLTCQPCTKPCISCENSITNCTSCVDNSNQSIPTCDCTSPSKYLNTSTYICEDCVSPCLNCSSVSQCDSCIDTYLLSGTVCIPCTKPCANCNGSVTTCTTCIDTNQTIPTCQCNTGYLMYSITKMCDQCTYPCSTCQTSLTYCLSCESTYTYDSIGNTCVCLSNQYKDNGSPAQCQNCSLQCLTCLNTNSNCTSCDNSLFRQLDNNQCICKDGYYDTGSCLPCTLPCITCSSATICLTCKNSNQTLPNCNCPAYYYMDLSYNCQQCQLPCQQCIVSSTQCTSCLNSNQSLFNDTCVCDDRYYMEESYNCQQCNHPCETCIGKADKCQTCLDNYFLDSEYICQKCQFPCSNCTSQSNCTQCADKYYISGSLCLSCSLPCGNCVESSTKCISCEDGYVLNDNNFCIFFKCLEPCLTCTIPSNCTTCIFGYFLDNNGICQQCGNDCKVCNELQICQYCKDGYFNQNYLCSKCDENCQTCMDSADNCQSCKSNEQLIEHKCYCTSRFDQDTCINCEYPCLACSNQNNCLKCAQLNGLYLNNENQCVCQDDYIWQNNQCESTCPLFCQLCQDGICTDCEKKYILINNICQQIQPCGNGFLDDIEQCDDQNINPNDGCYQCKIEENWNCNLEQPNQCTYYEPPSLNLIYLNQTQSIQYVELGFSQEIRTNSNQTLSQNIEFIVEGISQENQNITIYSIKEASNVLCFALYQIKVEIYELLMEKPKLSVKLNLDVFNEQEIRPENSECEIQLNIPKFMSPEQKQKAESASNANENIIFGLGAISALSLFLGEAAIFQEILRLLQYQSYLKYINLDYPENLEIFFKSTNIVSVSAIIKYTNLNYYLTKYSLKQGPLQTDGKFAYYQYDADLITNLACQILQLLGLVLIGLISNTLQHKFYNLQSINKYLNWMENVMEQHSKPIIFVFFKSLYSLIYSIFQGATNFAKQGLRSLFLINSQDLLFKAFIFLHYMQLNGIRNYVQALIAAIIIGSYLVLVFQSLSKNSFIFGLNKKNQVQMKYDIITLGRQTAFLGLLVFIQSNQILQTILMSFTNILYFFVLKRIKGMSDSFHKIQQTIELIVILFTISSFFFYKDLSTFFSEQFKIQVGWAQIAILLLSLVAEASKFIVAKTKGLVKYIQVKINEQKQKKNPDPMEQFHVIAM